MTTDIQKTEIYSSAIYIDNANRVQFSSRLGASLTLFTSILDAGSPFSILESYATKQCNKLPSLENKTKINELSF